MKFQLLHDALNDLDDIESWVTEHFGEAVAAATYASLFADFALLADFPKMGHKRRDISPRPVRFFFSGHYWIVYEDTTPLLIHRLIHPARDLKQMGL